MQELSMNILDIAQNSVRAGASLIEIGLKLDAAKKRQELTIADNGCGMDADMVQKVTDPFVTSRTTRKVGLGVPFLKMAAEMTGGDFAISSTPGVGTTVSAGFTLGHIDLMPLGDMGETMAVLVGANPGLDFVLRYEEDGRGFVFDTRDARNMLDGVPLSEPAVAVFIKDYVNENMQELKQAGPEQGS